MGLFQTGQGWKDILTITLPVLAAWVGTVLAFYFTKENFEAANSSVRKMVNQMSPQDRLKAISVKEVMNRRPHITGIKLEKNKTEDKVSLTVDIIGLFKDKVTRLPIFTETDAAKYVIHESLAYKFVYEHRIAKKDPTLQPNLQDLLNNPADKEWMTALAFVKETDSLADAQERMKQVPKCQDIFVTKNGQSGEPVLGWITNAAIAKEVEFREP
ncbi:MAG: hypothetical protein CV089_22095 [Nitrospira sp. WS110]|nr:hypothetical protein [Nitrospira sp. WS110]